MNDWKQAANKICTEKYSKNQLGTMDCISEKALKVSDEISKLLPALSEFQESIEQMRVRVVPSSSQMSLYHELTVISETNNAFIKIIERSQCGFQNLSWDLCQENDWDERISIVQQIQMQQTHMISNIIAFKSFGDFISNSLDVASELNNYERQLKEEEPEDYKSVVDSIVAERKELLNTDYNRSLEEIMENEKEDLPTPIMKALYGLYFSSRPLEGVFRHCTDASALEDYLRLIGVIDIQTITNVDIANVIRKFLATLKTAVWPKELLPKLIACTKENENDNQAWGEELELLTSQLPKANSSILKHLLCLCGKITQTPDSKMDEYGLSVCISLSTLVSKDEIETAALEIKTIIKAFELMIINRQTLFPDIDGCFKKGVDDVLTLPIYYDIFTNKKESIYFKRHSPKQTDLKQRIFNIGNYSLRSPRTTN